MLVAGAFSRSYTILEQYRVFFTGDNIPLRTQSAIVIANISVLSTLLTDLSASYDGVAVNPIVGTDFIKSNIVWEILSPVAWWASSAKIRPIFSIPMVSTSLSNERYVEMMMSASVSLVRPLNSDALNPAKLSSLSLVWLIKFKRGTNITSFFVSPLARAWGRYAWAMYENITVLPNPVGSL